MIERPTREPARPSTEGAPVTAKDFARRRLEALSRMGDAVLVLRSNPEQTRSADTHFPFRQDSDFLYLCGFAEPDSVLVLTPKHPEHSFVLFVRPRDLEKETWNVRRAGVLGAVERFGADAAFPIGELDQRLPAYLDGASSVYFTPGLDDEFNRRMEAILAGQRRVRARSGKGPVVRVEHGQALHPMRLFKTAEELPLLRAACEISSLAHNAALAATVALHVGVPFDAVADALMRAEASAWRMEVVEAPGGVTVINDAYNASPVATIAALDALAALPGATRRVAVLGEMRELGALSEAEHARVGRTVAAAGVDVLVAVGPLAAGYDVSPALGSAAEAAAAVAELVKPGDVVLVKGSRAVGLEAVAAKLRS